MNVYNRPVSRDMLKDPTVPDVKSIIFFFIEELYDKRLEDMAQPGFGCVEALDFPELYEDAIPSHHVLREAQKMFSSAHFDQFGIRDMHAPEKSRFHWQISALINFAKFRQTRLALFEEMAKNADDLLERERFLLTEKSEIQREITSIEAARATEQPQVDANREIVSEFGLKLVALHDEQLSLTESTRDLKNTFVSKTEEAAAIKMRKLASLQEVERMASRVVSSPDRVKGEIDDMTDALSTAKENVASMEKRTRTLKLRAKGVEKADSILQALLEITTECLTLKSRVTELEQKVNEGTSKKKGYFEELNGIQESRGHFERQLESVSVKLARVHDQRNGIGNKTTEADQKLAEDMKQGDAEEEEAKLVVEEKKKLLRSFQERVERCQEMFCEELTQLVNMQDVVRDRFTAYHSDISQVVNMILEKNEKSFKQIVEEVS